MKELLIKLLDQDESEYLDFKQEYHTNKAKLIHDILCLANSPHNGDKYIIFGVRDDDHSIVGVSNEKPPKQTDWIDLLRAALPNKGLYNDIRLNEIEIDHKKMGMLTIRNRPDKPFFLLKDYTEKGTRVRAGVVYTRNVDGNTPRDSSAKDDEMELLWRHRFGLDKPPTSRFYDYLEKIESWRRIEDEIQMEYYHFQFPEFRIRVDDLDTIYAKSVSVNDKWFSNKWLLGNGEIMRVRCRLMYWGLDLDSFIVWWGDNGRDPVPLPNISTIGPKDDSDIFSWSINRKSLKYRTGEILARGNGRNFERILSETRIDVL